MSDPTLKGQQVTFLALPILLACPVPITEDGSTLDEYGEALPLSERTHRCAVWAHWMIGGQVCCDVHTLHACEVLGIDFDGLVIEAGRDVADARVPWARRKRSTQQDAEQTEQASRRTAHEEWTL